MRKTLTIFLFITSFLFVSASSALAAIPTDPNFKVAVIGDSGAGSNFQKVLDLIKAEGAQLVLHQGDFAYDDGISTWQNKINTTLGSSFPYLGSDGNHESWSSYSSFFADRLTKMGLPTGTVTNTNGNYAATYKGLKMVFVKENGDPNHIRTQLEGNDNLWKICSWHKNQQFMQVGGKSNEQGWPDYETCREFGAIILTGHEHSYERTKTLTDMDTLKVDTVQHPLSGGIPGNPNSVLVGPGKTFVVVSGIGGVGIRNQDRCLPTTYPYGGGTGCNYIWSKVYTTDQSATYGALFITFNVGGNPNKATAYLKNVNGQIIDQFDITNTTGGVITTPTPTASPTASPSPSPTQSPTPTPSNTATASPTTTATPIPGTCYTADSSWQNLPIGQKTGTFTFRFSATPNGSLVDSVMGLSASQAGTYSEMAAIVRFNPNGTIDARNGTAYQAQNNISFSSGTKYNFRLEVNLANKTYSAYVAPQGGSEQTIGTNYAFRTEQNGIASINYFTMHSGDGSAQVCDVGSGVGSTIPGDGNNDNIVDGRDYVVWVNKYGTTTSQGPSAGDFNSDGIVDGKDYVIWVNNYGRTG